VVEHSSDSVEQGFPTFCGGDADRRIDGRIEVGDHERRGRKSGRLVNEHVRALVIAVVRDKQARGCGGRGEGVVRVQGFEQLSGFGAWSGAHVDDLFPS
jgi:hypothetical protein